ncbi:hypothetical protein U1Q18_029628 [Sarracenia purpurea var. burkii]
MEEGALFSPVRGSSMVDDSAADSLGQELINSGKNGVLLTQRCGSCVLLLLSLLGLKGAPFLLHFCNTFGVPHFIKD